MALHCLNCFTWTTRLSRAWRTGALCLLAETKQGLALVDTGPGLDDYSRPPAILHLLGRVTRLRMDPAETAVRQVARLGYDPHDVRHIVLTHLHFDHCGGVRDFPWATVHLHRRELEAFQGRPRRLLDLAYVRRHLQPRPDLALYAEAGESWYGLPAIRLPFAPEAWLVPLFGHTRGHCGVALRAGPGWHFHVGDAAPAGLDGAMPAWLVRLVLSLYAGRPNAARLRLFAAAHPEVRLTTGHMPLDFF